MNARLILGSLLMLGFGMALSAQQQTSDQTPSTTQKKAKHVYTNDDFPQPKSEDTVAAKDPNDKNGGAKTPTTPADATGKETKTGPTQTEALQKKSDDEKKNLEFLRNLLEKTLNDINDPKTSDSKRQSLLEKESGIRRSITDVTNKLEQANQDLADAQKNKDQKPADKPAPPPPKS